MISFIIPSYNEETRIELTLDEILKSIIKTKINDCEIIIIDDCSTDNTPQILKNLKKNKKFKIKYIVNTYNDHNYGLLKTIKKKIKIFFSSLLKSQYNDFLHKIKSLNFPNMSQIAEKHNIKFMNFSKLNKTSKKKKLFINQLCWWRNL